MKRWKIIAEGPMVGVFVYTARRSMHDGERLLRADGSSFDAIEFPDLAAEFERYDWPFGVGQLPDVSRLNDLVAA